MSFIALLSCGKIPWNPGILLEHVMHDSDFHSETQWGFGSRLRSNRMDAKETLGSKAGGVNSTEVLFSSPSFGRPVPFVLLLL